MSRYATGWIVSPLVVAVVVAVAVWWVVSRDPSTSHPPAGSAASAFASASPGKAPAPARAMPAVDALHRWDRARARAYAAGDVTGLRSLYVTGSPSGTSDLRVLRSYQRRGLRVEGMRMQILQVRVLAQAPGRWRLRVTDRLTGAVAVGDRGRRSLPRDEASTRIVTLRLHHGSWQVASVLQPCR